MTIHEMQTDFEQLDAQNYFAKGFVMAFGPKPQRNLNKAIRCFETAHQLLPNNIQYLNTLSEAYLQAKRSAMALNAATKANQLVSEDFTSAIALGRAAWFCGEKELSLDAFSQAYRLVPSNLPSLKERLQAITFSAASFWFEPCQGKRVALTRLKPIHREFLVSCRGNANFQHHYHLFQDNSTETIDRDLQKANAAPTETKQISWVVEREGVPIGLAELVDLNLNNSRAEIIVGFPEEQPFGISLEATLLVMEFAFSKIGIHKLISYVYGDNPKGQQNTVHLGFQQEGLLREHVFDSASGERLDLYVNGCLSTDFFQNKTIMKLTNRLLDRVPEANKNDFMNKMNHSDINSLIIGLANSRNEYRKAADSR